jgi:hypothetical protein
MPSSVGLSSTSLSVLTTLNPPSSTYRDSAVSAGTTYNYRVIATKGSVRYGSTIVPVSITFGPVCGDSVCDESESRDELDAHGRDESYQIAGEPADAGSSCI